MGVLWCYLELWGRGPGDGMCPYISQSTQRTRKKSLFVEENGGETLRVAYRSVLGTCGVTPRWERLALEYVSDAYRRAVGSGIWLFGGGK